MRKYIKYLIGVIFVVASFSANAKETADWLIYVYMVGSDLETDSASASTDIKEMMRGIKSDKVKVLVFTGGARKWNMSQISNKKNEVFEVSRGKITKLKSFPKNSMGESSTVIDFLKFGESNYNAKRRGIIFWNHGGGPTGGVGYDEFYNPDFLELSEIRQSFNTVYGKNKTFEFIGFDACLMATIDAAYMLGPWTNYMIASEDLEPALGWSYTSTLSKLSAKSDMNGAELGKVITDSYFKECLENDLNDITMSVINISKFNEFLKAFYRLGFAVLEKANGQGTSVYNKIDRFANKSESYGYKSREMGYTDSLDAGQFIDGLSSIAPKESAEAMKKLKEAVIYNRNGKYRKSNGLAMYYPFGKKKDQFNFMTKNGVLSPFLVLNGLSIKALDNSSSKSLLTKVTNAYKEIDATAPDYSGSSDIVIDDGDLGSVSTGTTDGLSEQATSSEGFIGNLLASVGNMNAPESLLADIDSIPVKLDKDYNSYIEIPKDKLESISYVDFTVATFELPSEKNPNGLMVILGVDDNLIEDWDTGRFTDQFDTSWPLMDGKYILPISVSESNDKYSLYDVDVKLNGKRANLVVVWDYEKEEYKVLGYQDVNEDGIPSRGQKPLKNGDKITTILLYSTLTGDEDEDMKELEYETFTYNTNMKIINESLGAGKYMLMYNVGDFTGNEKTSDIVVLETDGGDSIEVSLYQDFLESLNEDGDNSNDEDSDDNGNDDYDEEDDDEYNDGLQPLGRPLGSSR